MNSTIYVNGVGRKVAPYPGPILDGSDEEALMVEHAARVKSQEDAGREVTALASLTDAVVNQATTLKDLQRQITSSVAAMESLNNRLATVEQTVAGIDSPQHDQMVMLSSQIISEGTRARNTATEAADAMALQAAQLSERQDQLDTAVTEKTNLFANLWEGAQAQWKKWWGEKDTAVNKWMAGLDQRVDDRVDQLVGQKEFLVGGRQTGIEEWSWQWAPLAEPENVTRETPMVVRVGAQGPAGRTVASGGAGGGSGSGGAGYSCELPLPANTEIQLQFRLPGQSIGRSPERSASVVYQFDGDTTGNWSGGTLHISAVRDLGGSSSFTVGNELEGPITSRLEFRTVARADASNQVDVYVTSSTNGTIRCRLIDLYQV